MANRTYCVPGVVFLACAFILSLLVAVSLPALPTLDVARAQFDNSTAVQVGLNGAGQEQAKELRFGIWAYCVYNADGGDRTCIDPGHGYAIQISSEGDGNSTEVLDSSWTRGLAIHPVATGFAFLGLLSSFSQHITVMLLASVLSLLAAFLTLLAFAVDIALFVHLHNEVGKLDGVTAHTMPGPGFWVTLASFVLLLLASCTVCLGRRRARIATGVAYQEKAGFWASNASVSTYSHERRISKHRVTDEDLFNYVLRVAYLGYVMQPKAPEASSTNGDAPRAPEHSSRLSGALSSSIFSLGDLFRDVRDGSKSVKFPEKLLKILESRLENIAMGKDPGCLLGPADSPHDAVFYGQFKVESFKKQMKENRKIEELILMFATHATGVLKKDPALVGDGWKIELNNHIAQFVKLLQESFRSISHVSPELLSRLDMYAAKLVPVTQAPSDSGYDSASTSHRDSVSSVVGPSVNVRDMPLVMIVSNLFQIRTDLLQREVEKLKATCTERAALYDLKTCLKNINAGEPFPGRREDFDSEAAWNYWKTLETSHLSQLMVILVQLKPELAKSSTPSDATLSRSSTRPGSVYSAAARNGSISSRRSMLVMSQNLSEVDFMDGAPEDIDGDDDVQAGFNFTFIPPNPKKYYRRLIEYCLDADLRAMHDPNVNDDDQVSLGILSPGHIDLLNECALRWRISQPYRASCFLELIKGLYDRNEVPLDCIPEALSTILKVMNEISFDKWSVHDSEHLIGIYGSLYSSFLSTVYHMMDLLPNLKQSDLVPLLDTLDTIKASGLLERFEADIDARIQDIKERVRVVGAQYYEQRIAELQAAPGVNRALPLLLMTDDLEKTAQTLDKRFPEPILQQVDLVSLIVEVQVPMFVQDLNASRKRLFESSMNGPTPDVPIQDIFSLYRRTKTLLGMHEAFCPNQTMTFDLGGFFEPYVRQWLTEMDNKTAQWVQAAIAADKFEAEGAEGHSSSIIDLFDSLRSPITFLQDLEWSDEYQEARFFTSTISKAIEQYCRQIEELFMSEMFPRPTDYIQPQKPSAWLEKAKSLVEQGEKKVEPFNFQPASCVKLNNIDAARNLLDNMYNQMQVDKITEIIEAHGPPVPEKEERPRFLFTVKIVIAEGLVPLDASPSANLDTFVTLSDEGGNRLAKTRTIYETLSPRWDETFDISVEKPLWLMVSIRDRALVGKHDTVGRAYICLDPRRFGDFLVHDLWLDLDTEGRVLLRISMEGEKDDIQFFFGRAFRSLKRGEGDMVRIFIDKMSPFIRQSLSRNVLRSLVKTGNSGLDYNKALGGVTAFYRSALGGSSADPQIPLPSSEKPRVKPGELTDVEIEQAIVPLFDYFDANLQTLNTYLSEQTKEMVMTRLWKEILTTIEGLLIPPLSDTTSEMKPLSDKEVDIVFKWLKFLRDYFYAGGEGPLPLETLQNQKYRDVVSIRLYYDWHTDLLMEECVRMMQQTLRASPSIMKRAKSVYQQKNLGTIKNRKKEKMKEKEVSNGETIMRILRMRQGTSEFIAQQLQIMSTMQVEQEQAEREKAKRKLQRPRPASQIPAIPPLPELPSKS
ncbi:hypothetical protein EWM64_g4654 [Hericium alpestre]|uniref:C2 domain-containing protein n=1 Tax=Hericium alpestre TaxID=135208 RepID=A0A4Y9ZYU6_9AGAM|nr:hypothetical protein EWM64_g4654 [Hericium alpestre]